MKCVNHPEHEATEQCVFCKDVLCDDCAYEIGNKVYACGKCYDKYILKKAQPVQAPITTEVENQSLCCWHCNKKLSPTEVYKTTEYGQCYCDQCYNKLFDPTAAEVKQPKSQPKKKDNTTAVFVVMVLVAIAIFYIGFNSSKQQGSRKPSYTTNSYKYETTTSSYSYKSNNSTTSSSSSLGETSTDDKYSNSIEKYPISKDDLPKYNISSFENISSRNTKRMRFKITLSDRAISQDDVVNIGKFFYNTLIVDLNKDYGYIDGFQILIFGESDSQSWGATVGSISYNIDGSKKFQDASVVKSWKDAPSERDFQIVGALMNALAESNEKESVINQRIADKYGISVEELHNLYLETSYYRFPSKFDVE